MFILKQKDKSVFLPAKISQFIINYHIINKQRVIVKYRIIQIMEVCPYLYSSDRYHPRTRTSASPSTRPPPIA